MANHTEGREEKESAEEELRKKSLTGEGRKKLKRRKVKDITAGGKL